VILFNKYVWADATRPDYPAMATSMAMDPNGLAYFHPGWEYQTPVQLMSINTRRLAIACLHDPAWVERCLREFRKSIELGASGILYDEAFHHWSATHCFASQHGHRVPVTLWSGDFDFGVRLRHLVAQELGEEKFLLAAEAPYDLQQQHYGLSYFRIGPDHIPAERYIDPFYPIMIAATGFDDREMINRALLYRYIISYEPFNFKGDLTDFPLTLTYGQKVDDFRRRHFAYLWKGVYQHHRGAHIDAARPEKLAYAVFQVQDSHKRAVIIVNDDPETEATIEIALEDARPKFGFATPESPELKNWKEPRIPVAARSVGVLFEI
jgi:hypothetical protein